jgi:prephenate dehydrogenase
MNKIYNIAVVGAGQMGSMYLQSLKGIQLDVRIVVIDPNQESLEIAKL